MQSDERQVVICMDNHILTIDIESREEDTVSVTAGISMRDAHPKIINQCDLFQKRLLTCSRDPVIKMFDMEAESENRLIAEFKGHEMSVTSAA
jgi:hypothetical protein